MPIFQWLAQAANSALFGKDQIFARLAGGWVLFHYTAVSLLEFCQHEAIKADLCRRRDSCVGKRSPISCGNKESFIDGDGLSHGLPVTIYICIDPTTPFGGLHQ